jgi:hypothetical protein
MIGLLERLLEKNDMFQPYSREELLSRLGFSDENDAINHVRQAAWRTWSVVAPDVLNNLKWDRRYHATKAEVISTVMDFISTYGDDEKAVAYFDSLEYDEMRKILEDFFTEERYS